MRSESNDQLERRGGEELPESLVPVGLRNTKQFIDQVRQEGDLLLKNKEVGWVSSKPNREDRAHRTLSFSTRWSNPIGFLLNSFTHITSSRDGINEHRTFIKEIRKRIELTDNLREKAKLQARLDQARLENPGMLIEP